MCVVFLFLSRGRECNVAGGKWSSTKTKRKPTLSRRLLRQTKGLPNQRPELIFSERISSCLGEVTTARAPFFLEYEARFYPLMQAASPPQFSSPPGDSSELYQPEFRDRGGASDGTSGNTLMASKPVENQEDDGSRSEGNVDPQRDCCLATCGHVCPLCRPIVQQLLFLCQNCMFRHAPHPVRSPSTL